MHTWCCTPGVPRLTVVFTKTAMAEYTDKAKPCKEVESRWDFLAAANSGTKQGPTGIWRVMYERHVHFRLQLLHLAQLQLGGRILANVQTFQWMQVMLCSGGRSRSRGSPKRFLVRDL